MTTNRDTVTEWIEEQGETDATMLATAILDASHALAAIHEQLRIANLIAVARSDPTAQELLGQANSYSALGALTRVVEVGHPGSGDEASFTFLRPHIAAALGIPQEDHS